MKNSIKAIFVIIGTIIGAGFASGQEIYSFFNVYGVNGILGIVLSCVLIGFVIYRVLIKSKNKEINSYNDLLDKINIPKKIKDIFKIIINIFLLISFYIMVSGFSAYFKQEFNIPNYITAIIISTICYITFMKNIEGIANINSIIIPILICIILVLGEKNNVSYTIKNVDITNIQISGKWILRGVQYASYNSILLIPMLISLKKYTIGKERTVSIFTTFIFFILSMVIFGVMYNIQELEGIEIPLVYIANKSGSTFSMIYSIVIIVAIYTTMISAGYGFLTNCANTKRKYIKLALIICITSMFVSNISFSFLVNLTYPVFGILGILQVIYLLK